jgi:hypothetical protein
MIRFLWLVIRIAIVFCVAYFVYGFVYGFMWTTLGVSRSYLGWLAAMSIAGPLAAMAGAALAGVLLPEWKP